VVNALSAAQVFVFASHSEGRPNALMEAMACGLAVVATNIAGVRELIVDGSTGLLFEDGDIAGLAARIQFLAANPLERNRMGSAARQRMRDCPWRWADTANRYLALYAQAEAELR
jgi:glycosyltransferase involved in cell wall biosynthesis